MGLLMYGGEIMLQSLFKHINEMALHVCICICDIIHLYVAFALMLSIKEILPFYRSSILQPIQF